jgi:hypothetical protein
MARKKVADLLVDVLAETGVQRKYGVRRHFVFRSSIGIPISWSGQHFMQFKFHSCCAKSLLCPPYLSNL